MTPYHVLFVAITVFSLQNTGVISEIESPPDIYRKNVETQNTNTLMSLDINSNWQNYLIAAPSSIALLGSLVVISGKRTFELKSNADGSAFRYIKYPNFRTTILQVSNEGWNAFQAAHTNMEGIRIQAGSLPRLTRRASALLVKGTPKNIAKFIPIYLTAMKSAAKRCADLASETETKFHGVMLLLMEIDGALSDTSSHNNKELKRLENEIETSRKEKEMLEEMEQKAKQRFENITNQLDADRRSYLEAVRNIPSGFKATVAALFRRFSVTDLLTGRFIFKAIFEKPVDGKPSAPPSKAQFDEAATKYIENKMIFIKAETFVTVMNNFVSRLDDRIADFDGSIGSEFVEDTNTLKLALKISRNRTSEESDSTYKPVFLVILDETLVEIKKVEDLVKSNSFTKLDLINLKANIAELIMRANDLVKTGQEQSGVVDQEFNPISEQSISGNEEYIAQKRLQLLQANEQRYEAQYQQLLKYNAKLGILLEKLASMDFSQANIEQIQALIREAIELMAKLKEVWSTLVEMFQVLSANIDSVLSPSIKSFGKYVSTTTQMIAEDPAYQDLMFVKDTMQAEAEHMSTYATFVKTFAEMYVNISSEYLIGPLTEMAQLQLLSTEDEREAKLDSLSEKSKEAQALIVRLAEKKRIEFQEEVATQKANIDEIFHYVANDESSIERFVD